MRNFKIKNAYLKANFKTTIQKPSIKIAKKKNNKILKNPRLNFKSKNKVEAKILKFKN